MNLVLADTEEFRQVRSKSKKSGAPGTTAPLETEVEQKRTLGLTIVRGTHVVSIAMEGPPPADPSARLGGAPGVSAAALSSGPGIAKPAGRGLPIGLTGPAPGVGGPAPSGFPPGFAPPGFPGRGGPPREYYGRYTSRANDFIAGFPSFPGAPGNPQGMFQFGNRMKSGTNFSAGFQPPPGFPGRGFPPGFGGR
jgi:hypothetical protein